MTLDIRVFNNSSFKYLPKSKIIRALKNLLNKEGVSESLINVYYLDDNEIHRINNEFLNHNYPTDVITFPLEESPLEADIVIGVGVAKTQAKEYNVSLTNEIARLAIHGCLHILGYNDKSPKEKELMTKLENKYLKLGKV